MSRLTTNPNDRKAHAVRHMLLCLSFAERPLQSIELKHILAVMGMASAENDPEWDSHSPAQLALHCAGLVTLESSSFVDKAWPVQSDIRFAHHTAEEVCRKHRDRFFPGGQTTLARACMRQIVAWASRSRQGVDQMSNNASIHYAVARWFVHARHARETAVIAEIAAFLDDGVVMRQMIGLLRQTLGSSPYEIDVEPAFRSLVNLLTADSRHTGSDLSSVHLAAMFGLDAVAKHMLQEGARVDAKLPGGISPLHVAAAAGRTTIVQTLVDYGADVDARCVWPAFGSQSSRTQAMELASCAALHLAAAHGSMDVVSALLDAEADVDALDARGYTPLLVVLSEIADERLDGLVRVFVDAGADVNRAGGPHGHTALRLATRRSRLSVLRMLFGAGVDEKSWRDLEQDYFLPQGHAAALRHMELDSPQSSSGARRSRS